MHLSEIEEQQCQMVELCSSGITVICVLWEEEEEALMLKADSSLKHSEMDIMFDRETLQRLIMFLGDK